MVSSLGGVIDKIWQSSRPRQDVALEEVRRMDESDLLHVVAIDVCSANTALPVSSSFNEVEHVIAVEVASPQRFWRIAKGGSEPLATGQTLVYADIEETFAVSTIQGPTTSLAKGNRKISNVLSALQVARDHSDSILFLPADMREKRLQVYADEFEMPFPQFLFLASWHSRILAALA
jgi:hypothetical protein